MTHYELVSGNKRKSWVIIIGFITFITVAAYVMAVGFGYGLDIVGIALIVSGLISFGTYWFSDKLILAISGARPATRQEFFDYYTVTENLVMSQRMPMPKLYVIDDTAMNAFATGRNPKNAVVCATTGLLTRLNRREIEAVVAHELSHIQNYDMLLMSVVTILVGVVALLSDWMLRMTMFGGGDRRNREGGQIQLIFFVVGLVLAILSPLIAQLIKLAISRRREFLADASAVSMTKNPEGMASALETISRDREPLEAANKATAHLYFADPLKNLHGAVGMFAGLFQTHPPVTERIKALRSLWYTTQVSNTSFSSQAVQHIAQLANIPISSADEKMLSAAFTETIEVVAQMSKLDTSHTPPTHQVTGLENAWREDIVDAKRSFSQTAALANASKTHDGYFVVPQVIDQDE